MKEGKSACWHYYIVLCFPLLKSTHNSCKLGIQWYTDIAITTTIITVNGFNGYFAIWLGYVFSRKEICFCLPLIVHDTKSLRCQMVPYLSSYEDVGHKRLLIWKQKGTLSCISLGDAAKLLKQHVLIGLNNALSHVSLIRGVLLKNLLFHPKNLL